MDEYKTDELMFYTELVVVTTVVIILAQLWKDFIVRVIGTVSSGTFLLIILILSLVCILFLGYFFKSRLTGQENIVDIHNVLLKKEEDKKREVKKNQNLLHT